jgi:hypothetical protein
LKFIFFSYDLLEEAKKGGKLEASFFILRGDAPQAEYPNAVLITRIR